jgi:hypothetical protein
VCAIGERNVMMAMILIAKRNSAGTNMIGMADARIRGMKIRGMRIRGIKVTAAS